MTERKDRGRKGVSPRHEQKLKEQQEFDKRMHETALQLMKNPEFREFMWWFADQEVCDQECYTGNAQTYYNEGMLRNAKKKQKFLKRVNMSLYHKMEAENSPLNK